MNPATQVETKAVPKEPEVRIHSKLTGAHFVNSVPFAGETTAVAIPRNADSIIPARLETDGTAVAIDKGQRADGLLIRRKVHDRATGQRYLDQCFVPFCNIRGLQYSE